LIYRKRSSIRESLALLANHIGQNGLAAKLRGYRALLPGGVGESDKQLAGDGGRCHFCFNVTIASMYKFSPRSGGSF